MSDETHNSDSSACSIAQPDTVTTQEKKPLVCITCDKNISDDELHLICTNSRCGKVTCHECTTLMFRVLFAEPALRYPLSCSACGAEHSHHQIDGILTDQEQYEKYMACIFQLFWSKDCLQDHEALAQCPFCPYFEIHTTDSCSLDFLTCRRPSCGVRSCLICLLPVHDESDEAKHRSECRDLQKYRRMIDQALETGSKQHCPDCDLAGVKDNGCTHMTCERCGTRWCYLCGTKEEECFVDDNDDDDDHSFAEHNQDWYEKQGRCPMFLISIQELDDRWPDNDDDCLEYFHRFKTLSQLYNVMKIIGEDELETLNNRFGLIDITGYTIDEIKDHRYQTLINYEKEGEE